MAAAIKILKPIEQEYVGVYDRPGWYFQKWHDIKDHGFEPIFQCQFGHATSLRKYSIDKAGYVDGQFKCHCNKFTEWIQIAEWPSGWFKNQNEIVARK